jgi:hypothetical protein
VEVESVVVESVVVESVVVESAEVESAEVESAEVDFGLKQSRICYKKMHCPGFLLHIWYRT